jgi:hypothetical protein
MPRAIALKFFIIPPILCKCQATALKLRAEAA